MALPELLHLVGPNADGGDLDFVPQDPLSGLNGPDRVVRASVGDDQDDLSGFRSLQEGGAGKPESGSGRGASSGSEAEGDAIGLFTEIGQEVDLGAGGLPA